MRVEELDTPAVIVDLDVMEENIRSMAAYCRQHHLNLRPHTKTHKNPAIAKLQVQAGSPGITVAKVGEAEVMTEDGLEDILIAYPVFGRAKAARLARLAKDRRMTVALDSAEVAEGLSALACKSGSSLDVLLEFDAGMRRCGVETPSALVALGRCVEKLPNLGLKGVLFYPGHVWAKPEEQGPTLEALSYRVQTMLTAMSASGLNCQVVSGGSTPTAYNSHQVVGLTEIRPGTYVFNDRNTLGVGACRLEHCALRVMVTLVSHAVTGRAIIDGGSKTFSGDRWLSGDMTGFGLVVEHPGIQFEFMSEEHGHLNIANWDYRPRVGDRLAIIPNHVCACVNMHDRIHAHRKGIVEETWAVVGRGKVQ